MFLNILRNINKKYSLILVIVLLSIAGFIVWLNYINSQQQITIAYKNVSNVIIIEDSMSNNSSERSGVRHIVKRSGEKITLSKKSYIIKYKPNNGYENKNINFRLSDEKKYIKIDPNFTKDRLEGLRKKEFDEIKNIIVRTYPNIDKLYIIQPGKLYKKGEWYGTTIQYIGEDYVNSDTLRLVVQKKSNRWVLLTKPPNITISKLIYPSIPVDVLDDINNIQNTDILDRYKI